MAEQRPERPIRKPNRPGDPNGSNGNSNGGPNGGGMRFSRGIFGWMLFIALAMLLVWLLNVKSKPSQRIPLNEFWSRLPAVKEMVIDGDEIDGEFDKPQQIGTLGLVSNFTTPLSPGITSSW